MRKDSSVGTGKWTCAHTYTWKHTPKKRKMGEKIKKHLASRCGNGFCRDFGGAGPWIEFLSTRFYRCGMVPKSKSPIDVVDIVDMVGEFLCNVLLE